ncbi:beta strand repeat-containing protein [Flavobacterium sp.]|uniref:beta strand repeat-containing protein n=1 Tax=Flavobacterium sp. TaxID=239 RepID=UPI003BEEE09C
MNAQTTIASWTYDSLLGNAVSPLANFGTGTSSVVNLSTPTTATGLSSPTGCGSGNSGFAWQHIGFNPGSTNEVNGVQFKVGTTGYINTIFSWDQRFSKTAPNTVRLQYTLNGTTWTNFIMTGSNTTICAGTINLNGCFETNTGDSFRRVRVDFSSIAAVNNNPNFGIRLLASQYQSTGQYRQSTTPALAAGTTGTWRFDNVTFLGTPVIAGAVLSGSAIICPLTSTNINVTITGGISPYSVIYSNGTSNITVNNYISGANIPVFPSSTTTYTLVSVKDNTNTIMTPYSGSAIVSVNAGVSPTFITSAGTTSCSGSSIVYTTQSDMDNYNWTFLKGSIAAVLGTDYNIIAGSTDTETVTIQWLLSSGTATFSAAVSYDSCSGSIATSSTIVTIPSVTFTTQPGISTCINSNTTYSTQAGQFNYIWSISGILGTNYTIISGGTSSDNTLVIKWLTINGTVTVNYSNSSGCSSSPAISTAITILNALPIISFTVSPGASVCSSTSVIYTTQPGKSNYVWVLPGTLGIDYTITSGGIGASNNTVTLNWLTAGSKTVTVNYNNASGCSAFVSASSTTLVNLAPSITTQPSSVIQTTCQGTAFAPLSVTASGTNLTYQWYIRTSYITPAAGGIPITGASASTYTPQSTVANSSYYYVIVSISGCTAIKSICTNAYTVNTSSVGGSISGSASVCTGSNSTTLTLSGYTGAITKWQSSPFSNFSSGVQDISNTTNTLLATNLTSNTYYRAVVTNGACPPAFSLYASVVFSTTTWNGATWDTGNPDTTKKAVFASNYNLPNDIQACSMQVNPNVVVTVHPNHTYTITNEVIVDQSTSNPASLFFENSASLIQINPNVNNTTPIYYKRDSMPMKKYDYTYWSSPVSNQILNVFSPNTMNDKFYKWDTTTHYWSSVAANSIMNSGSGYIVRAPDVAPFNTVTPSVFNGQFYGVPNNGTLTTTIAYSTNNDSYNLIGNPYPGALDADAFLNYNSGVLAGTMYFWSHNTPISNYLYSYNDYASYNLTGGTGTIAPSNPCSGCNSSIPNGKVGAGQSFFIQGLTNGIATFTNPMRLGITNNSQFFKNSNPTFTLEGPKSRIWLDVFNSNGLYKQLLIGYLDGATNDFDTSYDGPVMDASNPIMFYSILNDKKLGIQGRALPFSDNDEIPLGYKTTVAGDYEIKLSSFDGFFNDQEVFLKDTLKNQLFNLKSGNYHFSTSEGIFEDRFKVLFTNSTFSTSNFSTASSSLIAYKNGTTIAIKFEGSKINAIEVYDIQGRLLNGYKNLNLSEFQFNAPYENQILVIKVITTDNSYFYRKI